jgi:lysozyme family protein
MAAFTDAMWAVCLAHEGKEYHDTAGDPGGPTKFGITFRLLQALGIDINGDGVTDWRDVRDITDQRARQIAAKEFFEKAGYSKLADQYIAAKVFDLAYNAGPHAANLILQRACRACARPVAEDGALGPQTLAVANGITPGVLLPAVRCEAASWYRLLVANGFPAKFLNGLLNRAYS